MSMPAGRYFIGDLCYVMNPQWDEFCSKTIVNHDCLDGEFQLNNGVKFASFGTAYGDGCYEDQQGNSYPVDAGLIGCIRLCDIDDPEANTQLGAIVDFDTDFECSEDEGVIYFGHIRIDTKGSDYAEEDSEEYETDED